MIVADGKENLFRTDNENDKEQLHKVEAAFGMTKAEIEDLGRKAGEAKGA